MLGQPLTSLMGTCRVACLDSFCSGISEHRFLGLSSMKFGTQISLNNPSVAMEV